MANLFGIGDVVRQKSGGPQMTVSGYDRGLFGETERPVKCTWKVGTTLAVGFFTEGELTKIDHLEE
jgi:uncharacterized protein YodC (DUF2158 family)